MYRYSSQDKYDTQYGKRPTYVVSGKSAGLGIVLSFLFAGLGHLYAGKIERGLGILIVYVLLLATSFLIFTTIIAIVLWIWAMVDVYGTIDEYNEYLARTGNPPL